MANRHLSVGNIRAHYVPQFYLRNFGSEIYCYDKLERRIRRTSPKTSCWEWNFYTRSFGGLNTLVEHVMGRWESDASAAISTVINKGSCTTMRDKHKDALCRFVAIQYLRTPEYRRMRQAEMNNALDALATDAGVDDWVIREKEGYGVLAHLRLILDSGISLSRRIAQKGVCLFVNETCRPLWTSDNPVVRHNDLLPNRGFDDLGMQVFLPLTPKMLLLFYDRDAYGDLPDVVPMNEANVTYNNHLQTRGSTQYVFSHTDSFDMVEKMIEANARYGSR